MKRIKRTPLQLRWQNVRFAVGFGFSFSLSLVLLRQACLTDWSLAEHLVAAGFNTPDELLASKPTQVHQRLNGFRKKNKLDVAALQLDEVTAWFDNAGNPAS